MKKSSKIIIILFGILVAAVALVTIPFPEPSLSKKNVSDLLLIYQRTGAAWLDIEVKRDGSASLVPAPFGSSSGTGFYPVATVSLSPDQLEALIQWIESERYTVRKSSFLSDLKNSERDKYFGTRTYYINDGRKMRAVNEDEYLIGISNEIWEKAQEAAKKNTD